MLDIILKLLVIISIIIFTIIGIWSFVLFNSFYNQIRYGNYLLEKVSHNIHTLSNNLKKLYEKEDFISEANNKDIKDSPSLK